MPSALSKRIVPSPLSGGNEINIRDQVTIKIHAGLFDFSYRLCPQKDPSDFIDQFQEFECLEDTFNLNYEYYESFVGGGLQVSSGAYIFRPRSNNKKEFSPIQSGRVFRGRYLTLVQVKHISYLC